MASYSPVMHLVCKSGGTTRIRGRTSIDGSLSGLGGVSAEDKTPDRMTGTGGINQHHGSPGRSILNADSLQKPVRRFDVMGQTARQVVHPGLRSERDKGQMGRR